MFWWSLNIIFSTEDCCIGRVDHMGEIIICFGSKKVINYWTVWMVYWLTWFSDDKMLAWMPDGRFFNEDKTLQCLIHLVKSHKNTHKYMCGYNVWVYIVWSSKNKLYEFHSVWCMICGELLVVEWWLGWWMSTKCII